MEKAQEIIYHIDELYGEKPSQYKVEQMAKANPVRYQAWVDAFKDYDLSDVLLAIDEYWEFKNSKTKPNVAQIRAILNAKSIERVKEATQTVAQAAKGDFAWERMAADIEAGCCRNALYVYRDAKRIVLTDWLSQEMPRDIWARMDYSARYKQAMDKGLYNNFDEALRMAAQARFGRDFEFLSKNDLENQKNSGTGDVNAVIGSLAAHWGA